MKPVKLVMLRASLWLLLFSLLGGDLAYGQFGIGRGRAGSFPANYGLQYQYFDPSEVQQILINFDRGVSGGPAAQRRRFSVSTLAISAGLRINTPNDSSNFRWRIKVADAQFSRRLITLGLTLFDLDHAGVAEASYYFIQGRVGLRRAFGNRKLTLVPQASGFVGNRAMEFGNQNYPLPKVQADTTYRGVEVGFYGGLYVAIGRRLSVNGRYRESVLIDMNEPQLKSIRADLQIALGRISGNPLFLLLGYQRETLNFNSGFGEAGLISDEITNTVYQAVLRIRIVPKRDEVPEFWD